MKGRVEGLRRKSSLWVERQRNNSSDENADDLVGGNSA